MVRIFPFSAISATPARTASTVMYFSSPTRMPVAQMVSKISSIRRSPFSWAAWTRRWYSSFDRSFSDLRNICRWSFKYFTLQSSRPMQVKNLFTAASMAFTEMGR